ncbi:MAG: hypothetical protein IJN64_14210 [Lachnospiraceae bacterium]|nr:hypothetical protein [Lachnospiraceae bacterium]
MSEQKLGYEISKRYSHELTNIYNKLEQLEKGRIYELSEVSMDGYLATNIGQLRKMIDELLVLFGKLDDAFNVILNATILC